MFTQYQNQISFILLLTTLAVSFGFGCVIQGTDSGVCTKKYLPASSELAAIEEAKTRWMQDMPFCGKWISNYYAPCVPSKPTSAWTAADANFHDGRLSSDGQEDINSIRSKDLWVEQQVNSAVQARIAIEKQEGSSHYNRNKDCQEAYARYTCWLNFPRCGEFDESLPMCQSVCENLFRVCGFAPDIWRCEAGEIDGNYEYNRRAFFPGQPFVRNEFLPKSNDPKAVCTPSIKGAAPSQYHRGRLWSSLLLGSIGLTIVWSF